MVTLLNKRQIKIGATYETKCWWCENGYITITDIQDDIAEVVYNKVELDGKLIKRRCIWHSPIKLLQKLIIKRVKFKGGKDDEI